MKHSMMKYGYFLLAVLLVFSPVNGFTAEHDLGFTEDEVKELERLERQMRGEDKAPAPAKDDAAVKEAEEKRKKAEAARKAEEKRKKAEAARKAESARKAKKEATRKAADVSGASAASEIKVLQAEIGIIKIKQAAMARKLKAAESVNTTAVNLNLSGFVDTSYFNDPNSDTSTFSFDQVEIDIESKVNDKASVRFDLQYANTGAALTADDIVEQGYININVSKITLTFGKFNAPIGFELLDAPDMYQYSHALVFDNGLPTNLTGAMAAYSQGIIDLSLYVVNGWDLISDDNTDKTFGGRLGITPFKPINIGFSVISGKENTAPNEHTLTVLDADLTYTGIDKLTVGGEYNSGSFEKESAVDSGDAKWNGYLAMAHYDFADWWGLTLRYDGFNDEDGTRLGSGVKESRNSFTVSPTFTIADGVGALVEYRHTKSNEKVFTDKDGNAKDTESTFAAEITYSF